MINSSKVSIQNNFYLGGLMSRVFTNGPGDRVSIPGLVIPKN